MGVRSRRQNLRRISRDEDVSDDDESDEVDLMTTRKQLQTKEEKALAYLINELSINREIVQKTDNIVKCVDCRWSDIKKISQLIVGWGQMRKSVEVCRWVQETETNQED